MKNSPEKTRLTSRNFGVAFAATVVGALVVSFSLFVVRNYYIKSYSDPLNWLEFARNIAEQFSTSRFSVGPAAFWWLILKLVGPYHVFLANLPVLILMTVMLALLARQAAAETESRPMAMFVGLVTMAFFLMYDRGMLVYLTNPYRDPLARLLLLSSGVLFLRYLQGSGKKVVLVSLSGLLLGIAICMREPSALFVGPLFLVGLAYRYKHREIGFWKSILLFGLFMVLGYSPCLIQNYSGSGQSIVPTYMASEGSLLPGFGLFPTSLTREKAFIYYSRGGIASVALFAAGAVFALRRRNKALLFLVLPAVLAYGGLYAFYWTFVFRYFLIVTLLVMPVAAFGVCKLVEAVFSPLRRPAVTAAALGMLVVVLAGNVVSGFMPTDRDHDGFRIPHARELTHDLEAVVPEGSTIICSRNLCEIIRWFTHADSYPAHGLFKPGYCSDTNVLGRINGWLASDTPPFYMEVPRDRTGTLGRSLLSRYFEFESHAEFSTKKYHLQGIQGEGKMILYRIVRQKQTVVKHTLDPPAGEDVILRVNTGGLWRDDVKRQYARISLNGKVLDDRPDAGANYYYLRAEDLKSPYLLVLESDAPVPASIDPVLLDAKNPLSMDLGVYEAVPHAELLSASIQERPSRTMYLRALRGNDSIRLPAPWPIGKTINAEFQVRAQPFGELGPIDFELRCRGESLGKFSIAREMFDFTSIVVQVERTDAAKHIVLDLLTGGEGTDLDEALDLDCINLFATPMERLLVDVGEPTDTPFVVSGFHDRESSEQGQSLRWTAAEAVVRLYDWQATSGLRVVVAYRHNSRPPSAPPENLKLFFNDQRLEVVVSLPADNSDLIHVEATVPADLVSPEDNYLKLRSDPWIPEEHIDKIIDGRELGIFVDSILVEPRVLPNKP